MAFGSILKGIGKVAGGLLGFGGGPSSDDVASKVLRGIGVAAPALGAIGKVTGGAAQGSADQRMLEGQQALGYGSLAQTAARDKFLSDLAGANAQFGAGMQGANFAREGQDRQRKSAVLSSLLGGMEDFKATPGNPAIARSMGTMTGGARPSALTGNKEALLALLAQPEIAAPSFSAPSPFVAPTLPQMPTQGLGEKILGGIGLGGSILGAIGGLGQDPRLRGSAPPVNGILNPELIRAGGLPVLEDTPPPGIDPRVWERVRFGS